MNIPLTSELEALANQMIQSGHYGSAKEAIREARGYWTSVIKRNNAKLDQL